MFCFCFLNNKLYWVDVLKKNGNKTVKTNKQQQHLNNNVLLYSFFPRGAKSSRITLIKLLLRNNFRGSSNSKPCLQELSIVSWSKPFTSCYAPDVATGNQWLPLVLKWLFVATMYLDSCWGDSWSILKTTFAFAALLRMIALLLIVPTRLWKFCPHHKNSNRETWLVLERI